MKRLLSCILILIMLLAMSLTACSKKELKSDDSDIQMLDKDGDEGSNGKGKSSNNTSKTEVIADENLTEATEDTLDNAPYYKSRANYDMTEEDTMIYDEPFYGYGDPGLGNYVPMYPNTEEYTKIKESGYKDTYLEPLSTFSIDVDTASYTNLRKNLNYGIIPQADAIRIEEMLNYFTYDYKEPQGGLPFSINTEIGKCPWKEGNYLLTVGILGKSVEKEALPKSNLVFLIDVSGSMDDEDKLPLLKNAFSQLVEVLGENDRISIVVYAGDSGVVLDSVPGSNKEIILDAIKNLSAGGSTGGAAGIELAYQLAEKNFIKDGNNRVILATDGDFNVGPSSVEELEEIITEKRESGIFLSVLGFGSGNLKDNRMETLADKGNGNYSYIDSSKEAKKVLVDEMAGTLLTIAKDVKIQIEFNPTHVAGYRLVGYENRALNNEDFKDDTVDAGELGAGHRVTAVYEIIPAGSNNSNSTIKYQTPKTEENSQYSNELLEIRLRYKEPDRDESREIRQAVTVDNIQKEDRLLSEDFLFASAVAEFGMLLRNSEYMGSSSVEEILRLAEAGLGEDEGGYRQEFINLVIQYDELLSYVW